jgi:4a-hydroxytetrahydrobiopterin dehydratase
MSRTGIGTANRELVSFWVKLKTHSAGGITDKDFDLARKIEEVVLWRPQGGALGTGNPKPFVFSKS